jgi:hypothetical protein
MIELPRAALTADEIAKHADFFSFGRMTSPKRLTVSRETTPKASSC